GLSPFDVTREVAAAICAGVPAARDRGHRHPRRRDAAAREASRGRAHRGPPAAERPHHACRSGQGRGGQRNVEAGGLLGAVAGSVGPWAVGSVTSFTWRRGWSTSPKG